MNKTVVDSSNRKINLGIKELIHYKDLLFILAYRDFKVRYAQTYLGFVWAFFQPVVTLLIYVLIFSKAAKVDTNGVPYALFALTGMCAWSYFSFVMSQAGNSIIGAQQMVQKIYFPRLVIPLSKAIVGLIDFAILLILLMIALIFYKTVPSQNIIFLPFFLFVAILASLGIGIWLSALTIRYRDFQHILPFFVQIGAYVTPVAYPSSIVVKNIPEWLSIVYFLNPMAGVVEGFRWCILGTPISSNYFILSYVIVVILFISSLFYFRKIERIMADIV